jgi:hypothetical protein
MTKLDILSSPTDLHASSRFIAFLISEFEIGTKNTISVH